ncbi:hypothetical protein [Streptomyces tendae]|uniref:hypothetical protein n=1 Tax=Streptomyces tendae TaxID=1932 RepID=UPI003EBD9516
MHSDLTQAEYDRQARDLLANLEHVDTTARHIPAPGPVAPGIAPFVVPDGYYVRETVETTADGHTRTVREVVPLVPVAETPAPAPVAPAAPAPAPAAVPSAITAHRSLPAWITPRTIAYGTGAAAVTTVGAVWGADIAASVSAGATALWHATVSVLKVVGICVGGALLLRLIFGGGRRRTGTFEGSVRGTWRQD